MSDSKFLELARERFELAKETDDKQRQRELEDIRFYNGQQWDKDLLDSRKGQILSTGSNQQVVPARPSLVINKTREPVRQVVNQERQSDLGIELIPADDFGDTGGPIDHTEIQLREGLVRRIQRDSEAADARTWAFSRSAIAGTGFWGVMTRYVPRKADQEVYVQRFFNQNSVYLDPSHEQPDGSDADWAFVGVDMAWDKHKAEFKGSTRVNTALSDDDWRGLGDQAPGWFKNEGTVRSVRVVEYWHTKRTSETLYHLSNGDAVKKEQLALLPPGVTVLVDDDGEPITHVDIIKQIKWAKINGVEVLDETDWPGHYIPIIKVVGEELHPVDGERRCEGIVRPMMDSCKGNNYIISKFVERVGLTPIPPIMMAGGQDEGYGDEYNAITTRTLGVVHYNQKDQFNQPAPPPFRIDARAEISDIAMGVQVFGQAIQATSVTPETGLGHTDPSVKSGKLAQALIQQAERGTSNFLDNLVRSMRHEARIINDLLYPIYGRPGRLARMMTGQNQMQSVIIGQPFQTQGEGKNAKPVPVDVPQGQPMPEGAQLLQLTPDAEFNVAVKVSKNFDTRRQEIAGTLGEIISSDPSQMMIIGDKVWKYFDLPDHEEIEERYKAVLDPRVQALLNKGQQPLPPEVQQQMQAMQQQVQELQQLADKNKTDLQKTQMQEQAETERAVLKQQADDQRAALERETKLAVAELGAKVDRLTLFLEERERVGAQSHEHDILSREQQHEREMAQLQHEQGMEQADQGAVIASQQAEQQAALQPPAEGA